MRPSALAVLRLMTVHTSSVLEPEDRVALEDTINIRRRASELIDLINSIGNQPPVPSVKA